MVWHETTNPAVIVMLTQTHESNREKCHAYFPIDLANPVVRLNEDDEFDDSQTLTMTLKNITEDENTRSTIREIELKDQSGETKTVWHYLFAAWPDFLVPEGADREALLTLIRISHEKTSTTQPEGHSTVVDDDQAPRIVHCSAGVGRTGTFIALDWLIAELDAGRLDNVEEDRDPVIEVIDKMRLQRMMMVQGEQQFNFLYDIVRELWQDRWDKGLVVRS